MKEALRKCDASLRRDNLSHQIKVVEHPTEVTSALTRFFCLHSARAASSMTPKHPDVFASASSQAFLREYMDRAAAAGDAKVFELVVDNEVVASRIGFVLDEACTSTPPAISRACANTR
jgi:hypothetical protein